MKYDILKLVFSHTLSMGGVQLPRLGNHKWCLSPDLSRREFNALLVVTKVNSM